MKTVRLMSTVSGTATNNSGADLFIVIDKYFAQGEKLRLSLEDATPLSTSFMSSSFGGIIQKYGLTFLKDHLVLADYKPSYAKDIKEYISSIRISE